MKSKVEVVVTLIAVGGLPEQVTPIETLDARKPMSFWLVSRAAQFGNAAGNTLEHPLTTGAGVGAAQAASVVLLELIIAYRAPRAAASSRLFKCQ